MTRSRYNEIISFLRLSGFRHHTLRKTVRDPSIMYIERLLSLLPRAKTFERKKAELVIVEVNEIVKAREKTIENVKIEIDKILDMEKAKILNLPSALKEDLEGMITPRPATGELYLIDKSLEAYKLLRSKKWTKKVVKKGFIGKATSNGNS